MAHNKLRREIDLHIRSWDGDALKHVQIGNGLLRRTLMVLGGPVSDSRPGPDIEGSGPEDIGGPAMPLPTQTPERARSRE